MDRASEIEFYIFIYYVFNKHFYVAISSHWHLQKPKQREENGNKPPRSQKEFLRPIFCSVQLLRRMLHSRCLVFCASSFNVFRPDQSTEYLEHTKKAQFSPCLSLSPFLTLACFCSVCCVHHVFHLDACHALLADSQSVRSGQDT